MSEKSYKEFGTLTDINEDSPHDTVHIIRWCPGEEASRLFACGSWDGKIRIYEYEKSGSYSYTNKRVNLKWGTGLGSPVVALDWFSQAELFAGTMDGKLYHIHFKDGNTQKASFDMPILSINVFLSQDTSILLVFLADNKMVAHNLKSNDSFPTKKISFDYAIVAVDMVDDWVAIAFDKSKFMLTDLKSLLSSSSFRYENMDLDAKLSCISLAQNKKYISFGTYQGRVSVQKIISSTYNSSLKYERQINFRAQRQPNSQEKHAVMCQVTCLKTLGTVDSPSLVTLGCGKPSIQFWDIKKKDNVIDILTDDKDVSAVAINGNCSLMAYGLGYTWDQGVWGLKNINYAPQIVVHELDKKQYVKSLY